MVVTNGLKIILLNFFFILFLFSCSFFQSSSDPMEIVIKGSQFSLAWDANPPSLQDNSIEIKFFKIYFRGRGSTNWNILTELPADTENPILTVTNDILEYGIYEFGVSSLSDSGVESEIHASTESTAEPSSGWYVNWIGSE